MLDSYSGGGYSEAQAQAVGVLMRDLGKLAHATYGVNGTLCDEAKLWSTLEHDYNCNVRQLENAIQRGMILNRDGVIYPDVLGLPETDVADRSELQWPVQPAVHIAETSDLGQHGRSAQYQYIADLMRKYQGNRSKIADLLGITPRALRYRLASMRKHGIEVFS